MWFQIDESCRDRCDQDFQDTLEELNQTVIDSGDPLEGNLFYHHHGTAHHAPVPDPSRATKRANFCLAIAGKRHLLEVGFNAGHSALMACAANPRIQFTAVDICSSSYARPCADIIRKRIGSRFSFIEGNSLEVLPRLSLLPERYDLIHVDGSHHTPSVIADLVNSIRLADLSVTSHILCDDTQLTDIAELFSGFCEAGLLVPDTLDGKWQHDNHMLGRVVYHL